MYPKPCLSACELYIVEVLGVAIASVFLCADLVQAQTLVPAAAAEGRLVVTALDVASERSVAAWV